MADDNNLSLSMNFDKVPGISEGGDFLINGLLYRDSTNTLVVKAHPMNSYLSAGETIWNIGESDIAIREHDLFVDNFIIRSGKQVITGLSDGVNIEIKKGIGLKDKIRGPQIVADSKEDK